MIKKVDVPFEDQETIINYAKHVIGEWAEVYTSDKVVMKRYIKFNKEHPDFCKIIGDDKYSMTFSVEPRCASLFPRAPRKVNLTDDQKEVLRERMRMMQNGK